MERSITQELDVAGMQRYSREYLEYEVCRDRSHMKAMMIPGVFADERDGGWGVDHGRYDHPDAMPGIHFGYAP